MKCDYQFILEIQRTDGTVVSRIRTQQDWEPALEWTHFQGVRARKLKAVMAPHRGTIEPLWHSAGGPPQVRACRVEIPGDDGDGEPVSAEIPLSYFYGVARRSCLALAKTGQTKAGDQLRCRVLAVPRESDPHPPAESPEQRARFCIEELSQPLPLRAGPPLADYLQASVSFGAVNPGHMPVFIPRRVIYEASVLTRKAGANETGGILIGQLRRAVAGDEIFAEITAQIPAKHTRSDLTSLSFTAETWSDVQSAIDLRGGGEVHLGWWHSHSYLKEICDRCERRRDGTCHASAAFMSTEDVALHRTVFPRAYTVALVISDSPCSGLTWELFGWDHGIVSSRGFHLLGGVEDEGQTIPQATAGGDQRATTH